MATFFNTETPIGVSQIQDIEILLGLNFPQEYRKHLLEFNGGQCTPNVFSFNDNGIITESCIDWFLAIYDGEFDNLKDYIETYKVKAKRLPFNIVPFAHDPGGNLICISCEGNDVGSIYFWDHEREVDYSIAGDNNYSNLYLIANSFNRFINGLKGTLT